MSDDVFEIVDYTNATKWEQFVTDLTKVVKEAHVDGNNNEFLIDWVDGQSWWLTRSDQANSTTHHNLHLWTGQPTLLVFKPANDKHALRTTSSIHMMMSAMVIALRQSATFIPCLCQVGPEARQVYFGVTVDDGTIGIYRFTHNYFVPEGLWSWVACKDLFAKRFDDEAVAFDISSRLIFVSGGWSDSRWRQVIKVQLIFWRP
jgi:hypothetical protein